MASAHRRMKKRRHHSARGPSKGQKKSGPRKRALRAGGPPKQFAELPWADYVYQLRTSSSSWY